MNMDGFKPFDFSIGVPKLSVTRNGVTFDRNTTIALDHAKYIKICVNEEKKSIFVCPGENGEVGSMKYYHEGKRVKSVRTASKAFLSCAISLSGRKLNDGFRVFGEKVDGGVLFDFNSSDPLV